MKPLLSLLFLSLATGGLFAADRPAPLKVLLITGGCCHDYAKQKDILKEGLEKRANVKVEQAHTDDKSVTPPLAILGKPDYAKGFDVVIHDECAAGVKDPATVEGVLKPHRDGLPAVNLHCAMHSYRTGNPGQPQKPGTPEALWFDFLGIQSSSHGPQLPVEITIADAANPITKGLNPWTTIKEELYNNIQVFPGATPLWKGKQTVAGKDVETVVAWTNNYGKTRVFSTTIGHNNDTVADERYLDFVTRGLLWACDKLTPEGAAKEGYGPAK